MARKPKKKKKAKKPKKNGRPTKYRKSFCKQIIKYFSVEPTKEVKVSYTNRKGEKWTKTELAAEPLMFLSNFAAKIGVCHDTLLEWCKVHPEFSEAYARAKELQKQHLIKCGLLGLFNSHFAIFTGKNIAGMKDKQEHEHTGKDGKPIPVQIVDFRGVDGSK
jgi:hypothetical protein